MIRRLTNPVLVICLIFSCMVHNFTTFIQKVAKCDEKQRTVDKIALTHYQNGWPA
jgi:hypothetical protein